MAAEQRPVVDDLGNIAVHGRSGLVLVVKIETATAGVYEDISASDLFFEIGGKLRLALSAGADIYSRQVILTRAQIATLSINQPYAFAIHDETPSTPSTPWTGTITTFGFKAAPTGVPDVDGEAANWTGATVIIQPGGGSPVVVVNYMGQPGAAGAAGVGIPTGGTTGQYLRKSSSTDYATGWDTLTADDVSGLSSTLSTLTSADVSLTTRLSTEETTRASADTSLATAAAATYLPLAGGVMTGALAAVAGTAALPGVAVAGDLDTGMYGVSANVLGVSAGGGVVQSWGVGTSTLTGVLTISRDVAASTGGLTLTNQNASGWGSALTFRGTLSGTIDTARILSQHPTTGQGEIQFQTALSSSLATRMTIAPTGATTITVADATSGVPLTLSTPSGSAYAQRILNRTYSTSLPVFSYYPQNDGVFLQGTDQATDLRIYTSGFSNPRLSITAAGSVGIGTTSPSTLFHVAGVTTLGGNLLASADNTYDEGALGANRVRRYYAGTQFVGPDGSNSSPAFAFAGDTTTGFYRDAGGGRIRIAVGGAYALNIGQSVLALVSDTAAIHLGSAADTLIARDAANTLALRNSTNTQTFRVYNTFTDSSNYERGSIAWAANLFTISAENAGTGSNRGISIVGKGQVTLESTLASVFLRTNNSNRWYVDPTGAFFAAVDNTLDIGASGANRPRNVYVGSQLVTGSHITMATGSQLSCAGAATLTSSTDGIWRMANNAGTDFGRLQFGGTSNAFPALRRTGTSVEAVLADNSAYTSFNADSITAATNRAIAAGGTAGVGFKVSSTANFGVFFGSGAPTLSAAKGSLYLRSDGSGTSDRMYVNTDGATAWTAVTTAT